MTPFIPKRWTTDPKYIELLNYLIQKAKDAKSPMSIRRTAREFNEKNGAETEKCFKQRIERMRTQIHSFEHIDTNTKVTLIFALSAPVNAHFLEELKKDAHITVDDKKRITHYKANDGSLELKGDHSRLEKHKSGKIDNKQCRRSLINKYFKNKNDAHADLKNEEEKEMRILIDFVTEKCVDVDTPLNFVQLTEDFNNRFGMSRSSSCIYTRVKAYCHEIQKTKFLDTSSKVRQLFGLSAKLDSNFLTQLRKDAVVEVDDLNRITKYTANNGRLTLNGDHSTSAKRKLAWIEKKKKRNAVKKHSDSGGDEDEESEKENRYPEEDSDEYSSEEFDSEFDSDNENIPLDEPQNHLDSSIDVHEFDDETPADVNSNSMEMSIDDNLDFDLPTERTPQPEETKKKEDEEKENNSEITGNTSVKTRYGRLSKKRHLDSEFSFDLANSRTAAAPRSTDSSTSKPAKQKKIAIEKEQVSSSSNQSTSLSRPRRRSIGSSPSPSISTESREKMENQNAPDADGNPSDSSCSNLESSEINHSSDVAPPNVNYWKNNTKHNGLINYIIQQTENVKSPMNIIQLVRDFKEKSGATQTVTCLRLRVLKVRKVIHRFGHIDKKTKVKLLFALSAPVDAAFLKQLKKDAVVKVDNEKRIALYKANDGSLEFRGEHNRSAKTRAGKLESKGSLRSMINSYYKNKNDADAFPKNEKEKEMGNLIELIIEKCETVNSPISINQLAKDFNKHFGFSRSPDCIQRRIRGYRREIQKAEFLDISSKVKQLFCLSVTLNSDFLKELRKDASVEVDDLNRITKYTSNDGRLTLNGDHSSSAKVRTAQLASKRSHRSLINSYFKKKNDADAVTENDEEKEMGNLIEFISEKCDNVNAPLNIARLAEDFIKHYGIARSLDCIYERVVSYRREIQKTEFLDTPSEVKQLFSLGAKLDLNYIEILRKDAVVEVDNLNRITKYTANDGHLTLHGDHSRSAKRKLAWIEWKKRNKAGKKQRNSGGDEDEESDNEIGYSENDSEEYSSEEFDSEFDSNDENDHLDETTDLMEPSKKADGFDNETPVRNRSSTKMSFDDNFYFDPPTETSHMSEEIEKGEDGGKVNDTGIIGNVITKKRYERSKRRYSDLEDDSDSHPKDSNDENDDLDKTQDLIEPSNKANDSDSETSDRSLAPSGISIDDNFDFDPPTERSHASEETEMKEDDEKDHPEITENEAVKTQRSETLPKSKTSSSTSHTPKTPKRKADAPAGSSSSKRTKPPSDESVNPGEMDNNCSYDDPPRIELNPVRGSLGFSKGTQKDSDIQQIPKPHSQVMEAPIKEEYEDESQTSLQTVLEAFKSLILSLDTPGLSQFLMELDKKIMEIGSGAEVSNKEVIMAIEFLIVKLSKHGALKSSEDSISLRDILLMLRTIILNSSFNGLEGILKMLKENIEKLEVLDKKVPVSKVECVLRATLDSIST